MAALLLWVLMEMPISGQGNDSGAAGGVGSSAYSSWGADTSSGQNVSGTYYFAGGGGGGGSITERPRGLGGYGGGGNGGIGGGTPGPSGFNGTDGTGGGGGGGSPGGNGGNGLCLIKMPGSKTATSTTGSPTRVETGGNTYYKFTGSGSITF